MCPNCDGLHCHRIDAVAASLGEHVISAEYLTFVLVYCLANCDCCARRMLGNRGTPHTTEAKERGAPRRATPLSSRQVPQFRAQQQTRKLGMNSQMVALSLFVLLLRIV